MSALTGSAAPPSVLPLAASFPPPPPSFHPLAALDSVPVGVSKATLPPGSADEPLVVVREASGALHVMHGLCAHKQGELHLGDLEEIGGKLCLTCPRHRKKFPGGLSFNVRSGAAVVKAEPLPEACYDPSWTVGVRETVVRDGWIFYK